MSARSRERSKELASYLKKNKVERTTGMCPIGCGRTFSVGTRGILDHLTACQGPARRGGRRIGNLVRAH